MNYFLLIIVSANMMYCDSVYIDYKLLYIVILLMLWYHRFSCGLFEHFYEIVILCGLTLELGSTGPPLFLSMNVVRQKSTIIKLNTILFQKVQAQGGVLSENDFENYSTALQQPAEAFYQGKHQLTY